MKLFILLAVVFAVLWFTRNWRGGIGRYKPNVKARQPPPAIAHEDILECAQCGLHLPRSETVTGRGVVFCSEAHRGAFEAAHPRV